MLKSKNRKSLKELIKERPVFGCGSFTLSTNNIEIMAKAGYDYVFIDIEHTPMSVTDAREYVQTSIMSGLHPIVRIPDNDEIEIRKAFEIGAEGIIIPHIRTKADIEKAVKAAKFTSYPDKGVFYDGVRSYDSNVRGAFYGGYHYDPVSYMRECERTQMVIAMCEDVQFVENVDEILEVEGIDAINFGPFDYSHSAHVDNFWIVDPKVRPDIQEAFSIVLKKAKEKGIQCIMGSYLAGSTIDSIKKQIEEGHRMISVGRSFDTFLVQDALLKLKKEILDNRE